jgi:hypothetical protein
VVFGTYDSFKNATDDMTADTNDVFWTETRYQKLLIIAVPYREGRHYAEYASDFVPIVKQLQSLHEAGYVHGDIRAFNTVFKNEKEGWLIDFDFGGKFPGIKYPAGYKPVLEDGRRVGQEKESITPREDWYALGKLIFDIHNVSSDTSIPQNIRIWKKLKENPTSDEVQDLINFLMSDDQKGIQLERDEAFDIVLRKHHEVEREARRTLAVPPVVHGSDFEIDMELVDPFANSLVGVYAGDHLRVKI